MYIMGISALYHDSAAALIRDGEIIAAAQEERFSRKKHDLRMPYNAMKYCMEQAAIGNDDLEAIVYYDNPFMTMDRFLCNMQNIDEPSDLMKMSFEGLTKGKMWWHKLSGDFSCKFLLHNIMPHMPRLRFIRRHLKSRSLSP